MPGKPVGSPGFGSLMLNVHSGFPEKASSAYIVPFHDPTYTTPSTTDGDAVTAAVPVPVEKNHRTSSRDTVALLITPSSGLKRFRVRSKPYVVQSARAGHDAGAGARIALNRMFARNRAVPPNSRQ